MNLRNLCSGDVVHYHLNASAHECRHDVDGQTVVARVVRLRPQEGFLDLHIEGSDLQKSQVPHGEGPGCWSEYVQPAEEQPVTDAVMAEPMGLSTETPMAPEEPKKRPRK